jgi:hypothetical protein
VRGLAKAQHRTSDWPTCPVLVRRTALTQRAGPLLDLAEDSLDLATRMVDDVDDALLLLSSSQVRGLYDRENN